METPVKSEIPKVVRDGQVAVLFAPGFGAGWFTWDAPAELMFDPELVDLVERDMRDKIESALEARGYDFYMGGARDLEIQWLAQGTEFQIEEYDGSESFNIKCETKWITA